VRAEDGLTLATTTAFWRSAVFDAGRLHGYLGARWRVEGAGPIDLAVRASSDGRNWSGWQSLPPLVHAALADPTEQASELITLAGR
jgi:hypothetical protein